MLIQKQEIESSLEQFNKKLYNAGFYFRFVSLSNKTLLIEGSFDFSYYVQLQIQFFEARFTNLSESEDWPDAWYDDQLILLHEDTANYFLSELNQIQLSENEYAFKFKSSSRKNATWGMVIAKGIQINFLS